MLFGFWPDQPHKIVVRVVMGCGDCCLELFGRKMRSSWIIHSVAFCKNSAPKYLLTSPLLSHRPEGTDITFIWAFKVVAKLYFSAETIQVIQNIPFNGNSQTMEISLFFILFQWSTPSEAVELFKSQDISIAPPQFYEFCRLCNFTSLHDLHRFASERALEGCERWMPVLMIASDGHMQILPGRSTWHLD